MRNRMVLLVSLLMVVLTGAAVALVLITAGEQPEPPTVTATESAPAADTSGTSIPAEATAPSSDSGLATYQISPQESEARFVIGEILRGQENTVVGTSSQVTGFLEIELQDPSNSSVGVIEIQADSFVTDSSLRDRAIDNFILNSSQYPVIEFEPQRLIGLRSEIQVGDPVTFQIEGLLTIRDVSLPVTFTVEAALLDGPRLEGSAVASINRSDFNLTIPSVPQVAGVDEQMNLEFDFTAYPLLGN